MNDETIPEHYIADDGHRIAAPTYEALMQCQLIMASAETGQTGPTLIEPGEHFTTESIPCQQWKPLNRAAGERMEAWLASLPMDGKNIPQELISEAAYQLRPREGDEEFPIAQWWPHVLRLAAKLADTRRGRVAAPTPGFRPMAANVSPMPFASTSSAYPSEAGRAPVAQQQPQNTAGMTARAQRQQRGAKPAMPGANVTPTPSTAAG
jgi:hypothetical protein